MSTGLILEGGGMRGIFAAGVIDYFLDKDIRFDNVIGVSAGACHACSYVCGQRGRAYATATDYLDSKDYCSFYSLRKTGDLFGADFIYHRIPENLYPIDNNEFLKRGMKFQAVVTNCTTGKAEYPEIRDMNRDMEIVRASSSLPLLARMVELDGIMYMDGGISDSIPLKQSIKQGNEKNVVVLTQPRGYKKHQNKLLPAIALKYKAYPWMVRAIAERHKQYNLTLRFIEEEEKKGNVFVIAPMGPLDLGRVEKNEEKLRKAYLEGYFVTEGLGGRLEEFLSK